MTQENTQDDAEARRFMFQAVHDLKAPLRAMGQLAEWTDEALQDATPEVRENLRLIRSRASRMMRLIDDLLLYSRSGEAPAAASDIDLGQLASGIAKQVGAERPGVTVETAGGMPRLKAPLEALRTLLHCLASNAVKHHDKAQGQVTISAKDLGASVEIMVEDDGPGIAEAQHERIFEPFQTLKPKDQVEGSGLGLAIVRRILKVHGASISLVSSPGKGCRFIVTWPKQF